MPKNHWKTKPAAHRAAAAKNNKQMQVIAANPYREQIISLLRECKLPYEDIPAEVSSFLVIVEDGKVAACAGIEPYGKYGLLRSVAVAPAFRNQGLAAVLLTAAERMAAEKGIEELYLLTETALGYFAGKGYIKTERHAVPVEVQRSGEFSHICPQSAIVMKKLITL